MSEEVSIARTEDGDVRVAWNGNVTLISKNVAEVLAGFFFEEAVKPSQPWHRARPGEVWLLTVDGEQVYAQPFLSGTTMWFFTGFRCGTWESYAAIDERITAGSRVLEILGEQNAA